MLISILVLPLSVLPCGRTQQCDNVTKFKTVVQGVRNDDEPT